MASLLLFTTCPRLRAFPAIGVDETTDSDQRLADLSSIAGGSVGLILYLCAFVQLLAHEGSSVDDRRSPADRGSTLAARRAGWIRPVSANAMV